MMVPTADGVAALRVDRPGDQQLEGLDVLFYVVVD